MNSEPVRQEPSFTVSQLSQHFSTQQQQQTTTATIMSSPVSKLPKVLQQIPKPAIARPTADDKNSVSNNSLVRRHSSTSSKGEAVRPVIRSSVESNYSPTLTHPREDVFQQLQNPCDTPTLASIDETTAVKAPVNQLQLNGTQENKHDKDEPASKPVMEPLKRELRATEAQLCIGLEAIQEQVRRRALRRGFTLNLMVIGRSGLGKTTLINTLFQTSIMQRPSPSELSTAKPAKTVEIRTIKRIIEEKGVKLYLSVTDTPGFGDMVDNTNCWAPALQYIDDQYSRYLEAEKATDRSRCIEDTRIHCCLYFIPPTGHGLRLLDLEVLKRLHSVTNVIPVLAKADTLTLEERCELKKLVQEDLRKNGIEVYPVKRYEDVEDAQVNEAIRRMLPFAVAGSENQYEVNGRRIVGRKHLWGLMEVENPNHCEFYHLRNLLIRTHMQDLVEMTSAIHYEAFRRKKLDEAPSFTSFDISTLSALDESHI